MAADESGDHPMFALRFLNDLDETDPEAAAAYEASQHAYLTASGTLTQFNAILSAVQCAALPMTAGMLRMAVAAALLLHVLAAFVLCWAARPVNPDRAADPRKVFAQSRMLALDTFKNYRRGWRLTIVALATSSFALTLYLAREISS